MTADEVRTRIGSETWESYFKFCVVRNPFEKVVSSFHHQEGRETRFGRRFSLRRLLGEWRAALAPARGDPQKAAFRRWLALGRLPIDRAIYTLGGALAVDYCIRHEQLDAGVAHVCERLGLAFTPGQLPHLKTGIRPKNRAVADYYDAETIAIVRRHFAFELEQFGYPDPA